MRTTLYLRKNEIELFQKLPAALRKKWERKIVEETRENFETDEEVEYRVARYSKNPTLASFLDTARERLATGEDIGTVLADMPEKTLKVFIDAIGNCGICALIEIAFMTTNITDDTLTGIAALSNIRHQQMMHKSVLS